jgi:lysophospholipase L1-like esterase
MTRHRFGGSADYVISLGTSNVATLQPSTTVTCWNAASGGTQYTDLTQTDGSTALPTLTTDATGAVPEFYGPDGVRSLYLDANGGSGPRRRTLATDIGEDLTTAETAYVPKSTVTSVGDLIVGSGSGTVTRLGTGQSGQLLIADPLVATRARWSPAWRRRDLPDPLLADTISSEIPTVTITQQSTSTISGAQALIGPSDSRFSYLGAGSFQFGSGTPDSSYYWSTSRYPNTVASGQFNYSVEFGTDASVFELKLKYQSSTASAYRLTVNGRKVTDNPVAFTSTTVGNSQVLKLDFGSAAHRQIRIDLATLPFGGIFLPAAATIWRIPSRGGRLGVLGDSITDGSTYNVGGGIGTWLYRAARRLGVTDVWDQSRGGTGYVTAGSYATLANRVALDITPYSFDRLIVFAGYNDNATDQTALGVAAASLYTTLLALSPAPEITVIGCWSPTGSPGASITNTDATLKTAATAAGIPFISPITGAVYNGAGTLLETQGAWITTANASTYVNTTDNVHPNDAGHAYLARRITAALAALMPA